MIRAAVCNEAQHCTGSRCAAHRLQQQLWFAQQLSCISATLLGLTDQSDFSSEVVAICADVTRRPGLAADGCSAFWSLRLELNQFGFGHVHQRPHHMVIRMGVNGGHNTGYRVIQGEHWCWTQAEFGDQRLVVIQEFRQDHAAL